jgi:DNA-binding PadR family transcriptional regulator
MENTDSPWDQPWSGPRRRGGPGGPGGHGGPGFRGGRGGSRGSWSAGPPPWVQGLIDMAQSGGQPDGRGHFGGHRGPKVRRGDVRSAILDVLAVEPMNGYQIIQQIAERSGGAWKPSPGSVYPTIAQLQDEALVEDAPEGRKTLRLTAEGREHVEANAERLATMWAAFDDEADDGETNDLRQVIGQTVGAIIQVASTGTSDQRDKAVDILADTRRRLYGLLAEGPDETDTDDETGNDEE